MKVKYFGVVSLACNLKRKTKEENNKLQHAF